MNEDKWIRIKIRILQIAIATLSIGLFLYLGAWTLGFIRYGVDGWELVK